MPREAKRIYFIRHGQSEGNLGIIHQIASTPLTEQGVRQAEIMAARAAKLPLEALIASTMTRAQQTAGKISEATGIAIESSDLFVERRRPSVQDEALRDDPDSQAIDAIIHEHFPNVGWRHSDEENFDDLKHRALSALAYLEARPEQHIAVVTHGMFMRIIMAVMLFGDTLTGTECQKAIRTFMVDNTGLTIAEYHPDDAGGHPWKIRVWNDHAHLA